MKRGGAEVPRVSIACIYIAGDRARRCEAAAQLSSNSSWPALRDCSTRESVPGQACRTPRGSSRGRDSPRSILDVGNPEARHY
eukprot:scaffold342_cov84-Phaeocystis_antarctica.AAC.1